MLERRIVRQIFDRLKSLGAGPSAISSNFQKDGFVKVPGILSPSETVRFRNRVIDHLKGGDDYYRNEPVFQQVVNVWQKDSTLRALTMNRRVHQIAKELAGIPLRLWHDQVLIKPPMNKAPTELHQDQPYWPHEESTTALTAWIALNDIPVERGCMIFLPGTHNLGRLPHHDLTDPRSLASICPDVDWISRVSVPLRAGDCTFHHGCCIHGAHSNKTEDPRLAFAIIFMGAKTRYSGDPHVVTDPLNLKGGDPIEGSEFPVI